MNPGQNMAIFSEDELAMNFEADFSSSGSESSSLYNSDSGVSVTTPASCSTWSTLDFERQDDSEYIYCDLNRFYQTYSAAVIQAIQCLSDVDIDVVLNASTYLFHLCKGGYASFITHICPDIFLNMKVPVFCPSSSKYVDVLHCLSGIINYLSQCQEGLDVIVNRGGLDIINGLLLFPFESVLYFCVTALHNILLSHKSAKSFIHRTCISNRLINLLNYSVEHAESGASRSQKSSVSIHKSINPKFLAVLCDCLYILAYRHESTKRSFKEQGGLSSLLKLITISTYEKVLWTATRLLRVLSAWIPVKCEIISQDPLLSFFSHCLECQSSRVAANALWTLRNLSDIAVDKISSNVSVNLVKQLLSHLKSNTYPDSCVNYSSNNLDDSSVFRCILGALANLTCRNNAAKCYIVRHNGIDLILQILYAEIREQKNYYHTFCDNLSESILNLSIQCTDEHDCSTIQQNSPIKTNHNNNNNCLLNNRFTKSSVIMKSSLSPSSLITPLIIVNNEMNYNSFEKLSISSSSSMSSMKCYSVKQKNELYNSHHSNFNYYYYHKNNSNISFNTPILLNGTLDLIEAGIRCLSHLTVGHIELLNVFKYFIHQRFASKLIISLGTIYLPSLLSFPFDQHINLCRNKDTTTNNNNNNDSSNTSTSNNWEFDCLTQVLQLTKSWSILVRNLCVTCSSTIVTSNMKTNQSEILINPSNSSNNITVNEINYGLWPKHLRSQLRHAAHKLVQSLRHIMNSLPGDFQPKELKTTMEFVHSLSVLLSNSTPNSQNSSNK
ncbi:unnamed protein product [Heterobilharzia americana]|nr:unnamed protein product [Heterobilharzia americana]